MRLDRSAGFPRLPALGFRKNPGFCGNRFARGGFFAVPVHVLAVALAVELLLRLMLQLLLQLFLGLRRLLLGFSERLFLGLGLQPQLFGPRLGALFLALLLASGAFAADRLQIRFKIVGAVIVIDLFAGLDVLDGADHHLAFARADVGFRIGLAGVIDVARDVLAHRAVDGPAVVELEQVFVLDRVVFFLP